MHCRNWITVIFCLTVGCARSESSSQIAFNPTSATVVKFNVPDMMCAEGCGVKTKEILSEQPGVKDVLVDFDTKSASVAIDEGKFDSGAAIAALVDHGFEQSSLKGEGGGIAKPQAAPAE